MHLFQGKRRRLKGLKRKTGSSVKIREEKRKRLKEKRNEGETERRAVDNKSRLKME